MDPDVLKITQLAVVAAAFIAAMVGVWGLVRAIRHLTRPKTGVLQGAGIDEARFARLEQAIDTIAIEVERVAEAQRFSAKLLSDRASETMTGRPTRE